MWLAFGLALLLAACSTSVPSIAHLSPDAKILAFGDSLTYGTGAGREQSYPAVLEHLTGRHVVNAGVPGEITQQGLKRLPRLLDEVQPELLVLCHGGNDILHKKDLDAAADNLRQMIRAAQSRNIAIVLIGVPKPGFLLSSADFYEEIAQEFNIPYEGEILADIESETSLKADTIHPNGNGYQVLAEAVFELLKKSGAI